LMDLAKQRSGLRRNHELDHRSRGLLLLRYREQRHAVGTRLVQEPRHRSHIVGAPRADHDVGLLNAKLKVAPRQKEGDRASGTARPRPHVFLASTPRASARCASLAATRWRTNPGESPTGSPASSVAGSPTTVVVWGCAARARPDTPGRESMRGVGVPATTLPF